jgi:cytochrome b561
LTRESPLLDLGFSFGEKTIKKLSLLSQAHKKTGCTLTGVLTLRVVPWLVEQALVL